MTVTLHVEVWPIDRLIPYAHNARTHSDAQVAQIAASISEFGFVNPVLVDPSNNIIAGHGRVLAARKLGFAEVPVIVLAHLNDNQRCAFMLADNRLPLNAGWDEEMLRLELEALAQAAYNLEVTGFDQKELNRLLADLSQKAMNDPDDAPPVEPQVVTGAGDLWVLGEHRLLCADSRQPDQLARVLEGRSSDMIFTTLPHGTHDEGKSARRLNMTNDILRDPFTAFLSTACKAMLAANAGAIYICVPSRELHNLHQAFCEAGGHWSAFIIWAKNGLTQGRSDYKRQYEAILYGWREGQSHYWCADRNQGDVWLMDEPVPNQAHRAMKPLALVERAILNSSRKGEVILDPFAGAGSTLLAAERTGRRARLVESDPRYVDVIVRRWQNYTGRIALLDPGGHSFAEMAEQRQAAMEPTQENVA